MSRHASIQPSSPRGEGVGGLRVGNPEVDPCVQSLEGETPRGTFPIARAPSARYIGHVSDVSRADDPYETLPAYEGQCDRLYDAVAPALPLSENDARGATSCSGF
jgi:hypothetical protein